MATGPIGWRDVLPPVLLMLVATLTALNVSHLADSSRLPAEVAASLNVGPVEPIAYLLIMFSFLPLAFARRHPSLVLAVTTLSAGLYFAFGLPTTITSTAPLLALYKLGVHRPRKTVWPIAAAALLFTLAFVVPGTQDSAPIGETIRVISVFALATSLGITARARREYIAEVENRAIEAERTREAEAERRVEEERLRIARDLHDVIAHSLSLIAVQAGAGARAVHRNPDAAEGALEAIRTTSAGALDELRSMLGVLRGGEEAPLEPTGRLDRLGELVRSVTSAGVAVTLDVDDAFTDIPAVVDISAYRVIQEALTNVVKHARATRVAISVRRREDSLFIEVSDDGDGITGNGTGSGEHGIAEGEPGSDGHGIAGMRERVATLGGTITVANAPEGGCRVAASLPLQSAPRRCQRD